MRNTGWTDEPLHYKQGAWRVNDVGVRQKVTRPTCHTVCPGEKLDFHFHTDGHFTSLGGKKAAEYNQSLALEAALR